jgi:hypothetical protein
MARYAKSEQCGSVLLLVVESEEGTTTGEVVFSKWLKRG